MYKSILRKLSNPKIFVFSIIWMMLLVVLGTWAQREMGLYYAQQKYFSNWFFWIGFFPTPGGRLIMFVMFFCILSLICRKTLWQIKKMGVLIVHSGALLLLFGGGLTAWFSFEGSMVLEEGAVSNFIVNSQRTELVFINTSIPTFDEVTAIPEKHLKDGNLLTIDALPFSVEILHFHTNVTPIRRDSPVSVDYHGMAKNFELSPLPNDKEVELNRPGVTFQIIDANPSTNGYYSIFMGQPVSQTIHINNNEYQVLLRRQRAYLPFSIELLDFTRILHPGTTIPKSFSSEVNLIENGIPRRVLIQMNEPLRHQVYTFFQASFSQDESGETSILAVVKNYGRLFPYISSIIMSIGLLIHLIMQIPKLIRKRQTL